MPDTGLIHRHRQILFCTKRSHTGE
ncbi:MAG: hypothetical protein RLZZ216_599, partial [Cyanobacteriota bacterium]